MALEDGPGVFGEILVAVVKGQGHGAGRDRRLAGEAGVHLVHGQHAVAHAGQPGHLGGKAVHPAVGGAVLAHGPSEFPEGAHLVVHEDVDAGGHGSGSGRGVVGRRGWPDVTRSRSGGVRCRAGYAPANRRLVTGPRLTDLEFSLQVKCHMLYQENTELTFRIRIDDPPLELFH